MSTPKGIEARLHKRADAELEEAVSRITNKCNNDLNAALPGNYATHSHITLTDDDEEDPRAAQTLLSTIGRKLLEHYRDQHREEAVKAFIEKVDTLQDQLDEIRDEIPQD